MKMNLTNNKKVVPLPIAKMIRICDKEICVTFKTQNSGESNINATIRSIKILEEMGAKLQYITNMLSDNFIPNPNKLLEFRDVMSKESFSDIQMLKILGHKYVNINEFNKTNVNISNAILKDILGGDWKPFVLQNPSILNINYVKISTVLNVLTRYMDIISIGSMLKLKGSAMFDINAESLEQTICACVNADLSHIIQSIIYQAEFLPENYCNAKNILKILSDLGVNKEELKSSDMQNLFFFSHDNFKNSIDLLKKLHVNNYEIISVIKSGVKIYEYNVVASALVDTFNKHKLDVAKIKNYMLSNLEVLFSNGENTMNILNMMYSSLFEEDCNNIIYKNPNVLALQYKKFKNNIKTLLNIWPDPEVCYKIIMSNNTILAANNDEILKYIKKMSECGFDKNQCKMLLFSGNNFNNGHANIDRFYALSVLKE